MQQNPDNLLCEQTKNPINVSDPKPEFSAIHHYPEIENGNGLIPKLWSKLEDGGDVVVPQIGTGGTVMGAPTYLEAKFNNGIFGPLTSDYCTFPTVANSINMNKGAIEFWGKMKYTSTTAYNCYWSFRTRLAPLIGIKFFVWGVGLPIQNYIEIRCYHPGGWFAVAKPYRDWNMDELVHFAVVWDREGNDISEDTTLALYMDGVQVASGDTTWVATSGFNANLFVCTSAYTPRQKANAVIDNLKTFDVCKTNFSDRNTEGV